MSISKLENRKLRIVFRWIFLLSAFVLMAWGLRWESFKILDVEIEIGEFQAEDSFHKDLKADLEKSLAYVKNQSFWEISLSDLEKEILKDKRIQSVALFRSLPFSNRMGEPFSPKKLLSVTLNISVKPQGVALLLLEPDGKMRPVSKDGAILPAVKSSQVRDLPILMSGPIWEDKEKRSELIRLLETLPDEALISTRAISEIHFKEGEGLLLILSQSALRVKLGESDWIQKAIHVEKVMSYLLTHQMEPAVLDARYTRKVVVKLAAKS